MAAVTLAGWNYCVEEHNTGVCQPNNALALEFLLHLKFHPTHHYLSAFSNLPAASTKLMDCVFNFSRCHFYFVEALSLSLSALSFSPSVADIHFTQPAHEHMLIISFKNLF